MFGWILMGGRETPTVVNDGRRNAYWSGVRVRGTSKVPSSTTSRSIGLRLRLRLRLRFRASRVCRPRLYFYSVIAPTGSVTEENGRERAIGDGVEDGKCLRRRT